MQTCDLGLWPFDPRTGSWV